jgi:hypothetical protein
MSPRQRNPASRQIQPRESSIRRGRGYIRTPAARRPRRALPLRRAPHGGRGGPPTARDGSTPAAGGLASAGTRRARCTGWEAEEGALPQRGGHHAGAPAPGRASGVPCTRSSPTRPPGDAGWRSVVARGGGDPSPLTDLWRCRRGVLGRRGSGAAHGEGRGNG